MPLGDLQLYSAFHVVISWVDPQNLHPALDTALCTWLAGRLFNTLARVFPPFEKLIWLQWDKDTRPQHNFNAADDRESRHGGDGVISNAQAVQLKFGFSDDLKSAVRVLIRGVNLGKFTPPAEWSPSPFYTHLHDLPFSLSISTPNGYPL